MTAFVFAQNKPKSPAAVATGKINDATISINYCSPSVNGRTIWGELVPFNKIWRAGANEATTFQTDKDVTIEGQKLPAGTYSFFVIPTEVDCTIIFNTEAKQWGAYKYDESKDQLRAKIIPKQSDSNIEKLSYAVNSDNVRLSWEKYYIEFKVN